MEDTRQAAIPIADGLVLVRETGDAPQIPYFWVELEGEVAVRSLLKIYRREIERGLPVEYTWSGDLPRSDTNLPGTLRLDLSYNSGGKRTRPAFVFDLPEQLPAFTRLLGGAP